MAVHALNALLGSIDRPGGLLVQHAPPLAPWKDVELDDIAEGGLEKPPLFESRSHSSKPLGHPLDELPTALTADPPYSLDTLLIDYQNPVYSRARPDIWRRALSEIPFVVSFSPFIDETTSEFADLILPDDTWLERWEDSGAAPNLGRAVFVLRQPVVDRLYDTRHTGDVIIDLAKGLGEGLEEAFTWKDFRTAFKAQVAGLHKSKSGTIIEKKGSAFLKRLYEEGFWAGEGYEYEQWGRVLRTSSGRFEFFSTAMWESLDELASERGLSIEGLATSLAGTSDPDTLCLPTYREMQTSGDPGRYPPAPRALQARHLRSRERGQSAVAR